MQAWRDHQLIMRRYVYFFRSVYLFFFFVFAFFFWFLGDRNLNSRTHIEYNFGKIVLFLLVPLDFCMFVLTEHFYTVLKYETNTYNLNTCTYNILQLVPAQIYIVSLKCIFAFNNIKHKSFVVRVLPIDMRRSRPQSHLFV